jgi:uncharacterized protein YeaO (DUF488 family)
MNPYRVKLKRVYEKPEKIDGFRVLIDRLWPRGLTKEKAKIDFWLKEIAPSNELRKWFAHDPEKWPEFQNKYKKELTIERDVAEKLKNIVREKKDVTLVYSAKDERHNNAIALKRIMHL